MTKCLFPEARTRRNGTYRGEVLECGRRLFDLAMPSSKDVQCKEQPPSLSGKATTSIENRNRASECSLSKTCNYPLKSGFLISKDERGAKKFKGDLVPKQRVAGGEGVPVWC